MWRPPIVPAVKEARRRPEKEAEKEEVEDVKCALSAPRVGTCWGVEEEERDASSPPDSRPLPPLLPLNPKLGIAVRLLLPLRRRAG